MLRNWSRYKTILKARQAGMTLKEAGALINVGVQRAREMQKTAICYLIMKNPSDLYHNNERYQMLLDITDRINQKCRKKQLNG